jgi:hypothetical protein
LLTPPAALALDGVRSGSALPVTPPAANHPQAPHHAAERANPSVPTRSKAPSQPSDPLPTRIGDALSRQAAALLAGDLAGFLAPADASLHGDLTRRFGSLRAMRVAVWDEAIGGSPTPAGDGSWAVPLQVTYCFVVAECSPVQSTIPTRWTDGAELRLVAFGSSPSDDLGPRPWEASELHAVVGPRVIVATTARYAAKLPAMLVAAERAAAVTDRYARWRRPPGRYVVYLAGPDEWGKWYGLRQQSWVAAIAMPLTDDATEVVLNASHVDSRDTDDVLRHEFTHVVTLVGVGRTYEHSWWLVEGVAEYVRITGGPHQNSADVRKYVHSGRWTGDVALDSPPADATAADVNGRYGVAYLAVQRLADRFGEDKMLAFFAAAARDGHPLEQASLETFGAPWAQVAADCAEYVRATAG